MVYCEPPNQIPPAVIQLANKYDYNCYRKFKPYKNIENYDVYQVLKQGYFRSYILANDKEVRYATSQEVKNNIILDFDWLCYYKCIPLKVIDGKTRQVYYYTE